MIKTPAKPDNELGLSLSGTPESGQRVTMTNENALQTIFGTEPPEMANALVAHCLIVGNVAAGGRVNDEK